jgi:hypothetical protein
VPIVTGSLITSPKCAYHNGIGKPPAGQSAHDITGLAITRAGALSKFLSFETQAGQAIFAAAVWLAAVPCGIHTARRTAYSRRAVQAGEEPGV